MKATLIIKNLFAYSDNAKSYCYAKLEPGINIISGRNTSGKSSFFLAILYAFGINDTNIQFGEVLKLNPFFRLDCTLIKNGVTSNLVLIREDATLIIQQSGLPTRRFNGINANNSAEHVKLKEYFHELFDFHLSLESVRDYKPAPIEVIFLPYYISQRVGWVYLRKSFSSLDYYKNFKVDYLDYYLGIENTDEREKKKVLEKRLRNIFEEITFLERYIADSDDLQISKLSDEDYVSKSREYIDEYAHRVKELTTDEKNYILKCNELGYLQERLSVLRRVSKHQHSNGVEAGECPVCKQALAYSLGDTYELLQEHNDTEAEITKHRKKIKEVQADINSLNERIRERKEEIQNKYRVMSRYSNAEHSFESWLNNKANLKLLKNAHEKIGELTIQKDGVSNQLKRFRSEDDLQDIRIEKSKEFSALFFRNLRDLNVRELTEPRFTRLYEISVFPSDGVELHKTIMAYHFAFNDLIKDTDDIHRLPFMLDAIFKEDIDASNKRLILNFISKRKPADTQIIMSIAEAIDHEMVIDTYNAQHFSGEANVISIGGGTKERAFLDEYDGQHDDLLMETLRIIEGSQ